MLSISDGKQFWSGLIFFTLGLAALWQLPSHIGTVVEMGPGYFPMLLGVCLVVLGAASMLLGVRASRPVRVERVPLAPLAYTLAGVLMFAALITRAGLAVSLLCLILACCNVRVMRRPLEILIIYLVVLGLTWTIFVYTIQLPIDLLW